MSKEATGALVAWLSPEKTMDQVILAILNQKSIEVPDGGDGGDGGDVYFRSSGRLSSLYDLRRAHFYGNDGKYGLVSLISNLEFKFKSTNFLNCVVQIEIWHNGQGNVLLGASGDRDIRNKEGQTV
jgi:hypothetical protein